MNTYKNSTNFLTSKLIYCPKCKHTIKADLWGIAICIPCRIRIQLKH